MKRLSLKEAVIEALILMKTSLTPSEIADVFISYNIPCTSTSSSISRIIRKSIHECEEIFVEEEKGTFTINYEIAKAFLKSKKFALSNCIAGIHWSSDMIHNVPEKEGVYILYSESRRERKCIYIGQAGQADDSSGSLKQRLQSHGNEFTHFSFVVLDHDYVRLMEQFLVGAFTSKLGKESVDVTLSNIALIHADKQAFVGRRKTFKSVEVK